MSCFIHFLLTYAVAVFSGSSTHLDEFVVGSDGKLMSVDVGVAMIRRDKSSRLRVEDQLSPRPTEFKHQENSSLFMEQCDQSWGLFGHDELSRTLHNPSQRNDIHFTDWKDHVNGAQGLFIAPEQNFAFCTIEKNACSAWNKVLRNIFQNATGKFSKAKNDIMVNGESQTEFGIKGIEKVFSNPQATRVVFVRDPLIRFASAFMDKCVAAGVDMDERFCPSKSRIFRDAVEWALHQDMTTVDGHWQLQSAHCQLRDRVKGYTVVGLMHKGTLSRDAACVLSKAGLSEFNNAFTPSEKHLNQKLGINEEDIAKKLFTPSAARALIEKLHGDYETFGFNKKPAWIEEAIGDWYDVEPPEKRIKAVRLQMFETAQIESEVDDLVELASRAGYI